MGLGSTGKAAVGIASDTDGASVTCADGSVYRARRIALAPTMAAAAGRIHVCGKHIATGARGLEGALESSERVAIEVLSA